MEEYARQQGLRRLFVPVPLLTPRLSSLWLGLVTPLFARVGRKLIESITMPSVVRDRRALAAFRIRPCGFRSAIRQALADEEARIVATRWSDALSASAGGSWRRAPAPAGPEATPAAGTLTNCRRLRNHCRQWLSRSRLRPLHKTN